jgi:fatty-acid desaturase
MSEKDTKSFNQQLAVASAIGVVGGLADFAATTIYMHREYAHKAHKLARPLAMIGRIIIWGTGTRPRVWATVHRQHHKFADKEGDPHSPVLQGDHGVLKLFFKNTPMYSRAARAVEKADVFAADLQPDELDKKVFDKTKLGLAASLAGHVVVNKAVGNPGYMGAASWLVEKAVYISGGNLVNSIGHAGAKVGNAIVKGEQPTPHPDGSYGADSKLVGALTMGEGNQKYHHEHPKSVFFGPNPEEHSWIENVVRDLGGTAALAAIKVGWAKPGEAPLVAA